LKDDPAFVDLKIVDKWDGLTPLVIGGNDRLVYQMQDLEHLRQSRQNANTNQPDSSSPGSR
jgi:hypothetical protein